MANEREKLLEVFRLSLDRQLEDETTRLSSLLKIQREENIKQIRQTAESAQQEAVDDYLSEMQRVKNMRADGTDDFLLVEFEKSVEDQFEIRTKGNDRIFGELIKQIS